MKLSLITMLLAVSSAIQINDDENDKNDHEEELDNTKCLGDGRSFSEKGKVEGFYKKAPVTRINGDKAIELVHGLETLNKNHFVLMYHPKCPDDEQMFPEFNKFA